MTTPTPPEYYKRDHSHCWESEKPPCGQKVKHFECCLCKELHPDMAAPTTSGGWRNRFMAIGEGSVRFIALRSEVFELIEKELTLARLEERENTLKQLWLDEFVGDNKRCRLCRNGGMLVDMDGMRRYCICPNGRAELNKLREKK